MGTIAKTVLQTLLAGASALSAMGVVQATPASDHPPFPPLEEAVRRSAQFGDEGWLNVAREGQGALGVGDWQSLQALIPPEKNSGDDWRIHKTSWSAEDERGYEAFVTAIGRSGCISIDDCLRSPANPYRDLEDERLWLGDCTDMVYVLRGYYAWKNGLPFSYQDGIAVRSPNEPQSDIRYSEFGNRVTSRFDVVDPGSRAPYNGPELLTRLFNIVSTAMLRTHAEDERGAFDDFYPVEITPEAIRPGTIAYDIYGHVSIIYDITEEGRILMISSHPDYTVSRDIYGPAILRSAPELGGGIKAWRPIRLVGARERSDGTYVGGRIVGAKNADIPDFSMEQFFGNEPDASGDWESGRFIANGRPYPYYDYVRLKLRNPELPADPVGDVASALDGLCSSLRARRTAVNLAVYAGIPFEPAPEKLPENIYGTYGDWERYSTPSRDARLRTQAVELYQMVVDLVTRYEGGDAELRSSAGHLPTALYDVYQQKSKDCRIVYKRSDDTTVRLTMDDAIERLFDFSFDPFHCPERRWGARGDELRTCTDGPDKAKWYEAQRFLRNDPSRTYDLRTDFTADQLQDPKVAPPQDGGLGRSEPPVVSIGRYLAPKADPHVLEGADLPVRVLKGLQRMN